MESICLFASGRQSLKYKKMSGVMFAFCLRAGKMRLGGLDLCNDVGRHVDTFSELLHWHRAQSLPKSSRSILSPLHVWLLWFRVNICLRCDGRAEEICLYCGHVGMIKKGRFHKVLRCSRGCFSEFLHLFLWLCEVVCSCAPQAVVRDFGDSYH